MPKEDTKKELLHLYAYEKNRESKHISEVESGKKGYRCIDCGGEMIAYKGNIKPHQFRHAPTDIKIERKCVFSSETYRHRIAKEILQRIKEIKVPAIYKLPPKEVDGGYHKVQAARIIKAHSVKNERQFYQTSNGEIKYGQDIDFEKDKSKTLLIKPDTAFFDEDDNPILLIEFYVTHKVDDEKLAKLKSLCINTIEIKIPTASEEEIEKSFYKTNATRWLYNNEYEQAEYIYTPKGNGEGVPPINEFQRRMVGRLEAYECKKANLEILYGKLQDIWNQNHIEPLRENSFEKYKELRRIQKEIKSDCKYYRKNTEQNLKEGLKQRRMQLDLRKKQLKEQKKSFENIIEAWKKGIIQSENNLNQKEQSFEEEKILWQKDIMKRKKGLITNKKEIELNANLKLIELQKSLQNMEVEMAPLKKKLESWSWKKRDLEIGLEKKNLELQQVKESKENSKMFLNSEEKAFEQEKRHMEMKQTQLLKEKRMNLEKNLRNLQDKLIIQLKTELLQETIQSTTVLETCMKNETISWIDSYLLNKEKVVLRDLNGLEKAVAKELTRLRLNEKEFIELMEQYES